MSRHFSPPSLPPPRDHLRNPSTLNTEAFASASHFSPSLKTDEVTHVHHGPHIISNTCFHGGFFLCVCLSAAYQSVFATRAYSFDGLFDLFWGVRLNVLLRILSLFSSFLFWVALFSNCNVNYLPKFSSDPPPPSMFTSIEQHSGPRAFDSFSYTVVARAAVSVFLQYTAYCSLTLFDCYHADFLVHPPPTHPQLPCCRD